MAEENVAPQAGAALEAGEEEEEAVMRIGERPGARASIQHTASDLRPMASCWGAACPRRLVSENWTSWATRALFAATSRSPADWGRPLCRQALLRWQLGVVMQLADVERQVP